MEKPQQVDSTVPRGKAAFHTLIPAIAFLINPITPDFVGPAIVGVTGLLMAVSVAGGPRYSLFGKLFNQVLRPALKIKPGQPEQAAPHRFAETIGAVFLIGAGVLFALGSSSAGFTTAGWVVTLIVVALAALNWLAGICVGCQMYLLLARLRAGSGAAA